MIQKFKKKIVDAYFEPIKQNIMRNENVNKPQNQQSCQTAVISRFHSCLA